jgi:hypothetical protein
MQTPRRTGSVLLTAVAAVLLLAACSDGGAQSQGDAKQPGDDVKASSDSSTCDQAGKDAVQAIDAANTSGTDIILADVVPSGSVWYVSTNLSGSDVDENGSPVIGLWGTSTDPTKASFDGTLTPLNGAAKKFSDTTSSSMATTGASDYSASGDAAKRVVACAKTDAATVQ